MSHVNPSIKWLIIIITHIPIEKKKRKCESGGRFENRTQLERATVTLEFKRWELNPISPLTR